MQAACNGAKFQNVPIHEAVAVEVDLVVDDLLGDVEEHVEASVEEAIGMVLGGILDGLNVKQSPSGLISSTGYQADQQLAGSYTHVSLTAPSVLQLIVAAGHHKVAILHA